MSLFPVSSTVSLEFVNVFLMYLARFYKRYFILFFDSSSRCMRANNSIFLSVWSFGIESTFCCCLISVIFNKYYININNLCHLFKIDDNTYHHANNPFKYSKAATAFSEIRLHDPFTIQITHYFKYWYPLIAWLIPGSAAIWAGKKYIRSSARM